MKVGMLVEIRAVARRAPVGAHLADDPGGGECLEAIVDRSERDVFGAFEEVRRSGMIALIPEHIVNLLPLARHAEAFRESRNGGCRASSGRWHWIRCGEGDTSTV